MIHLKKNDNLDIINEKYKCFCNFIFPKEITKEIGICEIFNYNNGEFKISCILCKNGIIINKLLAYKLYLIKFYTTFNPNNLYDLLICNCYIKFPIIMPPIIGNFDITNYDNINGEFCFQCIKCILGRKYSIKYKYDIKKLYKKNFYISFDPKILYTYVICNCRL